MKQLVWLIDGVVVLMSAAVGFFVGLVGLQMAKLIGMGAWSTVIMLTVFCFVLFVIVVVVERASDRLFPSGIKAAPAGTKKTNKAERRRKRNGWIAFFVGAVVAIVASVFFPVEQIMDYF